MDQLSAFGDYASTKLQTAGSFISSHSPTIVSNFCSKTGSLASSFFSECGNMLKSAGSDLKNRAIPFLSSKLSSAKEMIARNPKIAGGVAIALVAVIGVATAAKYVMGKRNTGNSTEPNPPVAQTVNDIETQLKEKKDELHKARQDQSTSDMKATGSERAPLNPKIAILRADIKALETNLAAAKAEGK